MPTIMPTLHAARSASDHTARSMHPLSPLPNINIFTSNSLTRASLAVDSLDILGLKGLRKVSTQTPPLGSSYTSLMLWCGHFGVQSRVAYLCNGIAWSKNPLRILAFVPSTLRTFRPSYISRSLHRRVCTRATGGRFFCGVSYIALLV